MPGMLCMREDGVAGVPVEQAVLHHPARAPPPPSSAGWKIRFSVPVKRPAFGQMARRGQQHRGVAVVAAGVHHAGVAAGIGQAGGLVDRQGVHVGAQAEPALAVAAHQPADDAGAAEAALHLVAPGLQLLGHQGRGAVLVEGELGVVVDVAPQPDEFIRLAVHVVEECAHRGPHCGCRLIDLAIAR